MHATPEALARVNRLLRQDIRPALIADRRACVVEATEEFLDPVAARAARDAAHVAPFTRGGVWGRAWHTRWFRLTATVPDGWSPDERYEVALHVDLGFGTVLPGFQAEGLVHSGDRPLQGLQPDRRFVPRPDARPGDVVDLWVEAAATPMLIGDFSPTPLGDPATAPEAPLYSLRAAELVRRDRDVGALRLELILVLDLLGALPEGDPLRTRLLHALTSAVVAVRPDDVAGSAAAARAALAPVLAVPSAPGRHRLVASGHAHLDTAWLWPLRETRRKVLRTAVNALGILARHPGTVFTMSQACQYAWLEEDRPELFAEVRERVAEGRWEVAGGMWVETDLNLPDGESLVRQFLHGQRAFTAWFGRRCEGAFLPDDFGYPASFPQIARLAGCRWFFTQKLSWNDTNRFPHHTFRWQGLDGSSLLTHFSPVETYSATLVPSQLLHAERTFADHAVQDASLVLYGHGDGGGGPTDEMLERFALVADWCGTPPVAHGSVGSFFDDHVHDRPDLPVWSGELYLETHRGTSSSQRRTKQANRTCELALHDAELWSVAAGRDLQDRLAPLWRRTLTQQFHDVLPGSSIAWVHAEAEAELTEVAGAVRALEQEVLGDGHDVLANPASVPVRGVVDVDGAAMWVELDTASWGPGGGDALPADVGPVVVDGHSIDNGRLRLVWDERGHVVSLRHHATGRDVVPPGGRADLLVLRQDRPAQFDAWDVDELDTRVAGTVLEASSVEVVEAGPLRAVLRSVHAAGRTRIVRNLTMAAGSDRLEVVVEADWQASEQRLQVVWPVDVHATEATCGIQFGHVRRPRHANTSWDRARFESTAHRYVHVGEHGFGVALMADGPHGYDVRGDALRLTLLRSARYPDPGADRGTQRLAYAVWVHPGEAFAAGLEAEAARRAHPVRRIRAATASGRGPRWTGDPGVRIAAVKHAEDGSGDVVVRLWESHGGRGRGALDPGFPVAAATITDLLEEAGEPIDGLALELRPFQILTVRVTRA